MNARLAAAVEKARKESVSRDVIERAIKKGAGASEEKLVMEHVVFEGYAPHKVPVIVEPDLSEEQRAEVGEFLQELEDHNDVHRVWAAVR